MKSPRWLPLILILLLFGFGKEAPPPPLAPKIGITDSGVLCLVAERSGVKVATLVGRTLDWSLNREACKTPAALLTNPKVWIENPNGARQGYCKDDECGALRVQPDDMNFMPAKKKRRIRMTFNGKTSTLMTLKNFPAGAVETKVYETPDKEHRIVTMFVRYGRSMCPPSMHEVIVWVDANGRKQWLYEGFMNVEHELTETPKMDPLFEEN